MLGDSNHFPARFLGAVAFVTPILKAVPYDVTNKSGQYAALVALCAAALVFAESVRWEGHAIINRSRRPVVGAFLLGSAYLWLADESKSNPASWDLPTNIAIVWILASLVVAAPLALSFFRDWHPLSPDGLPQSPKGLYRKQEDMRQ